MKGKKVFVGLSGGVDSAVSAYLLLQEGYEVHGVFIQTWTPEWMECGWREDRRDAMRVAIHLGIPYHDLDLSREYKQGVADYMVEEYRAGRTPNPDVMCNREVKFGGFLRYALAAGADYVATGHYARVSDSPPSGERSSTKVLLRGVDISKDQSYFLWTLTQEQLHHVLFPVGGYNKSEIRRIAEMAGLPVATKKDSQGICFLGQVDMKEFLLHYIDQQQGAVLDIDSNVIGNHDGVWFVTLGQRFGGEITSAEYRGKPLFVVAKDIENNTVKVGIEPSGARGVSLRSVAEKGDSFGKALVVLEQCVIRGVVDPNKKYTIQIRYHGELISAQVTDLDTLAGTCNINCENVILVASGQSIVVYDCEVCLGGGIVD